MSPIHMELRNKWKGKKKKQLEDHCSQNSAVSQPMDKKPTNIDCICTNRDTKMEKRKKNQ